MSHQVDAALYNGLVQLHIGNAIHEQAAYTISPFVDGDRVASLIELRGAREAGWTGTNHGHLFPGPFLRWVRDNPAFGKAAINDGAFNVFDGDRRVRNPEYARPLARRRTYPTGELRKIIGFVQPLQRLPPEAAIDEVIPLRDQVINRTTRGHAADQGSGMTEWDAAIHAAAALLLKFALGKMLVKLPPVINPLGW